ncbi:hypothetical protein FACS1894163_03990 [Spirochaetia bacterium]|nr:hypothetical protein FACS1894163_03990 [Spirochaetia bacterium]
MFVQFLVEDISGERLIHAIMAKYNLEISDMPIEYKIRSYRGIGGLRKGPNAKDIKSEQLLTELPKRMRAFNVELKYNNEAALFIICDNDTRDTPVFKNKLEETARLNGISIDYVFCIAVEEMEAWLLGDRAAIYAAYPNLNDRVRSKHPQYVQDSICGTWEFLADMLSKKGIGQFRKENPTFVEIGIKKSEWAQNIGEHLSIRDNVSPSFKYFLDELDKRIAKNVKTGQC